MFRAPLGPKLATWARASDASGVRPRRVPATRRAPPGAHSHRDRAVTAPAFEGGAEAAAMADAEYSSSSVTFLWGFGPAAAARLHATLEHHNVFLAEDPSDTPEADDGGVYGGRAWLGALPGRGRTGVFPDTDRAGAGPPRFPFYLCCPSKTDPAAARNGGAAVMVLVPVPCARDAPDAAEDERRLVAAARRGVLRALVDDAAVFDSAAAAEAAIEAERVVTPREWAARFGLRRGAVFGLAHGLDQLGPFRPGLRARTADNLFYCGASAQPGNGIPLVMVSAKKAASLAEDAAQARAEARGRARYHAPRA